MKANGLKLTVVAAATVAALGGAYSLGHANSAPAPAPTPPVQIVSAGPVTTPSAQFECKHFIVFMNNQSYWKGIAAIIAAIPSC